jgi:hypothetical protein
LLLGYKNMRESAGKIVEGLADDDDDKLHDRLAALEEATAKPR